MTRPTRSRSASSSRRSPDVATTTHTEEATLIQTRHRIPEVELTEDQILVYQVPIPEPLRFLEPRESETRRMHALEEYGLMHLKLYEDIARHGAISTAYAYPVQVEGRYMMDPSPIPKFDNPKLESRCIQLFGAGPGTAHLCAAALHKGGVAGFRGLPVRSLESPAPVCALRLGPPAISTRSSPMIRARGCLCAPTPIIARGAGPR